MRIHKQLFILSFALFFVGLAACATQRAAEGIAVRDLNPDQAGQLRCLGIEGHDILNISRKAVKDIENTLMKQNVALAKRDQPIRIIVDSQQFSNETSQAVNLNMIADQLASDLQRAAGKRMAFLSREDIAAVEQERKLKRQGKVDQGALGLADKIAGADYRMAGRLTSHHIVSKKSAQKVATHLALWVIDLETGVRIWSWVANILKQGVDEDFC